MINFEKHIDTKAAVLEEIKFPGIKSGNRFYIKREDKFHHAISGNKWRKLKYNLIEAKRQGKETLLTFGGAYSNHIYATASAGNLFGFKTIGLIRGEEHLPLNPTLTFAKEIGMEIHYVNRSDYRKRYDNDFIEKIYEQFGDVYLIPEGGTNLLALKGAKEIVDDIEIDFDYICSACGTGGTIAGIISGLDNHKYAIGFPVLKGASFLERNITKLIKDFTGKEFNNWHLELNYHFGGYAKIKAELINFIEEFETLNGIKLDPVYTGKMMYGIFDLERKGYFKKGSTIIAIHTGGLQGIEGMKPKIEKLKLTVKNTLKMH